jgi:hypothetical protein
LRYGATRCLVTVSGFCDFFGSHDVISMTETGFPSRESGGFLN